MTEQTGENRNAPTRLIKPFAPDYDSADLILKSHDILHEVKGSGTESFPVPPEKIKPVSHAANHVGDGTCILHPPYQYKPSSDGLIRLWIETDCNDNTGVGEWSRASQWECPAHEYLIIDQLEGQLDLCYGWHLSSASTDLEITSNHTSPFPDGFVDGEVLMFIGVWKLVNGGFQSIKFKEARIHYDSLGKLKTPPQHRMKRDLNQFIGVEVYKSSADSLLVRGGLRLVNTLALFGTEGTARTSVDASLTECSCTPVLG